VLEVDVDPRYLLIKDTEVYREVVVELCDGSVAVEVDAVG
jgi:hypothetical protein